MGKLSKINLDESTKLFCFDKDTTKYLAQEIVDNELYSHPLIKINKGDVVFDVGANVGVFSLYITKKYAGDLKVYSFEPIPEIFQVLKKNIESNEISKNVKLFNQGLTRTDGPKQATFTFYEKMSSVSTMKEELIKEKFFDIQSVKTAALLYKIIRKRVNKFTYWFYRIIFFIKPVANIIYNLKRKYYLKHKKVNCELTTLTEIIKQNNIPRIDFLKIDVEGAEFDILHGIDESDWKIIKQISMEIHNDAEIDCITDLLKKKGFKNIDVIKDRFCETDATNFHKLFAVR